MDELPSSCSYLALGAARIREIKTIINKLGELPSFLVDYSKLEYLCVSLGNVDRVLRYESDFIFG